jgi:hypothetical protein
VQAILIFAAVAALSVLASNRKLLEAGQLLQLAQLSASGLHFLGLGMLFGPGLTGVLTVEDLGHLRPLTALGLGLGGLLVGLNLDLRVLRRLPVAAYAAAAAQSVVPFGAVAVPVAVLLVLYGGVASWQPALSAAAVLGAAASVSSGHLAILWYRSGRLDQARGLAVSLLSMLDDLTGVGVLAVGLVFAATGVGAGLGWVVLTVAIGLASGALIAFLIHATHDVTELMAIVIGGVALVSGAAAYLKLSVLISALCCGATLAFVGGPNVERIYQVLSRFERPAYLILLFLIGAHVDALQPIAWAGLPLVVALRFFGKLAGGKWAASIARTVLPLPPRLGYALLAQGAVALCVLTDYLLLVQTPTAKLIFAVGAMATVANEALAARAFARSLVPHEGATA